MFNDLEYVLRHADLADTIKLPLTILIKAVGWFPWVFVGVGLILSRDFFIYWLGFFLFIEGLLLAALVYLLVAVVQTELANSENPNANRSTSSDENSAEPMKDVIVKGVLGNVAFYLFILMVFVVAKGMGMFDEIWQTILSRLTAAD